MDHFPSVGWLSFRAMPPFHRHLGVVALLKALRTRPHDPALRVREVALRLILRHPVPTLVGWTSFRIAGHTRLAAASIVSLALLSLQPLHRRTDRRQAILTTAQLLRQLVATIALPVLSVLASVRLLSLLQQLRNLRLETRRLFAHTTVAHRLPLARVRPDLRAVDRQLPQTRHTQPARQLNHLHEQRPELRQVKTTKLADRLMARIVARRQYPERHVVHQLPRDLPRRKHSRRVTVDQQLHHHPRLVRRTTATVTFVPTVETRQVQIVHHVAHMKRQVLLWKPLPKVRRQQQLLLRLISTKSCRHPLTSRLVKNRPTTFFGASF